MSVVDDYGRFVADWRVLRSELYPLRTEQVTQRQIEGWLEECSRLIDDEDEPLICVYTVHRKKYLQINNFGQRIRGERKYPEPPGLSNGKGGREREKQLKLDGNSRANGSGSPSVAARANASDSDSDSDSDSEAPARDWPSHGREVFEAVVAVYPEAGRGDLGDAESVFRRLCRDRNENSIDDLAAQITRGIDRFERGDYRWRSGRVHLLKNFLDQKLWLEKPLPVSGEPRGKKRPTLVNAIAAGEVKDLEEYQRKYPKTS